MGDHPAENLALNLRQLREARGMTQQQLAKASGIPRATCSNLETGSANPTLAVLLKIGGALQVSLEELIAPPRAAARLYRKGTLPTKHRGTVTVSHVLPDPTAGLQFERIELPPGGSMTGVPHTPGTREYLACEQGQVELTAAGEKWTLSAGDVLVFRGDQKHAYRNPGRSTAIAYSVVALAPVPER